MKSFRLCKPIFRKRSKKLKSKLSGIFKTPLILTILISFLVSIFVASTISVLSINYLKFWLQKNLQQKDLFLETQIPSGLGEEASFRKMKSIPEVVKQASPAVVSVIVSKLVPIIEQYYFNPFGEDSPFDIRIPRLRQKGEELKEVGGGTGFIVSRDGLIVTNKHVALDEEAEYTVLTNEGEKYPASVLARDPIQDIAILKIDANNLPVIKLGNSNTLEIGQTVIAIGNALGEFRNTVSVGVISGLLRSIVATGGGITEQLEEVIQTDAAINRGNSGGPLINLYGEVIGINTAIALEAENIGFAIPINKVRKDIGDVKTKGRIVYPFLGIRYVLINKVIAEQRGLPVDYGVLIIKGDNPEEIAITPDSAADKAGLRERDIILEINNRRIDEDNPLAKLILKYNPGDQVALKILREGEEMVVKVILGEWE
jgi:S1-C subfamily serine protease